MKAVATLACLTLLLSSNTGCGLLVLHNALERNADRKEVQERHRHEERMRELQLQERLQDKQYPTPAPTSAIVRDAPF